MFIVDQAGMAGKLMPLITNKRTKMGSRHLFGEIGRVFWSEMAGEERTDIWSYRF